jgi:hypothetical protein
VVTDASTYDVAPYWRRGEKIGDGSEEAAQAERMKAQLAAGADVQDLIEEALYT